MRILITGGNGFVGKSLCRAVLAEGHDVIAPVRTMNGIEELDVNLIKVAGLDNIDSKFLTENNVEVIVHCAGVAHRPKIDDAAYFESNTELTVQLAKAAKACGVRRFIFLSSIGVNGSSNSVPFRADDTPNPYNAYTQSKLLAEQALERLARGTGFEYTVIRPPLIYGSGAPGNFSRFVKLVKAPLPKPLGSIDNLRSFVSIDNLNDFIISCLTDARACNEIFLVSDGDDLSTSEFFKLIAESLRTPHWLFPFPLKILRLLLTPLGKRELIDKLSVNLQANIDKNFEKLGWKPKASVRQSLYKTFGRDL